MSEVELRNNIVILATYPPPYGGISSLMESLIPHLIKSDYNVDLFDFSGVGENISSKGLNVYKPSKRELYSFKNFDAYLLIKILKLFKKNKIICVGLKTVFKFSFYITYMKKNIVLENRTNLIFSTHLFNNGLLASVLGCKYNILYVTLTFGEIYKNTQFFKKNKRAVEFIIDNAEKIIAPSKHCAESYKLLNLEPEVDVIYSGVDKSKFMPIQNSIIKKTIGFNAADFVVLFIGRLIFDMGLDYLIKAIPVVLKENNNVRFIVAGANGELTDKVIKLKAKYPKSIAYAVDFPFDDLPSYYAASDLVVAPTRDDRACMGLAIKEAMFSKKPVIGNRVGGIPEAIVHNQTGLLIDTSNITEFSSNILKLVNDKELSIKMGKMGYSRAVNLFSSEVTNKRYAELFDKIINGNETYNNET